MLIMAVSIIVAARSLEVRCPRNPSFHGRFRFYLNHMDISIFLVDYEDKKNVIDVRYQKRDRI